VLITIYTPTTGISEIPNECKLFPAHLITISSPNYLLAGIIVIKRFLVKQFKTL
jgi:hypothetical protein